jgi:hypothetical protein
LRQNNKQSLTGDNDVFLCFTCCIWRRSVWCSSRRIAGFYNGRFPGFLVGVAVQLATGNADFFGIPFGAFGPHVGGFASGVAAVAYATNRRKFENARDITAGMMGLNSPDVLFIGGLFGIDPPAATIALLTSLSLLVQALGVYGLIVLF